MNPESINLKRRQALKVLASGVGLGVLGAAGLLRHRAASAVQVYQESRPMLGTLINIRIHHSDTRVASQASAAAFEAIREVDRVMSIHRPDSDLSRVNRLAGSESVVVPAMLTEVMQIANRVHELSGGAYDVTCLPLMRLYGFYDSGVRHYPSDRQVLTTLDAVGQRFVSLNSETNELGITHAGSGIDLGSIGKGFAVDRAVDTLRAHGIKNALVDAGGNIYAMGDAAEHETGWSVAIRNPMNVGAYFETLTLKDMAVATSGNYEQAVVLDGRRVGHHLDMRDGRPADARLSTTIVATTAVLADALSTPNFVLGVQAPEALTRLAQKIVHHNTVTG